MPTDVGSRVLVLTYRDHEIIKMVLAEEGIDFAMPDEKGCYEVTGILHVSRSAV